MLPQMRHASLRAGQTLAHGVVGDAHEGELAVHRHRRGVRGGADLRAWLCA
jgi:hypothetical protein